MIVQLLKYAFRATAVLALLSYLPPYLLNATPLHDLFTYVIGSNSDVATVWLAIFLFQLGWSESKTSQETPEARASVYGLQHGRLHLQTPTPMWMNMGYWKVSVEPQQRICVNIKLTVQVADEKWDTSPKTMAEACCDLLNVVLTEAGLMHAPDTTQALDKPPRSKSIIDLGFGCGDQTIYLMSESPVRPCDEAWWDNRDGRPQFNQYIGITKDPTQYQYARERANEITSKKPTKTDTPPKPTNADPKITLFCADAATPHAWTQDLRNTVISAKDTSSEHWVLALDTAYHFAPSRWPLIQHAFTALDASYMAFDLCLSPDATLGQKVALRVLTTLMGAPWTNFVTPDQYRRRLVEVGYSEEDVKVRDVSEHVFAPLAEYMAEQDRRLKALGLGIGGLRVARWMFAWWGRTGVVRGVVVVARKSSTG